MALSLPPPTQRLTTKEMITEPWYRFLARLTGLANATVRTVLSSNATYYVRSGGNDDTGDGSADTDAKAFATLQAAYDHIYENIDAAGYTITIQVADGTYGPSAASIANNFPTVITFREGRAGRGPIIINGNQATPANVVIDLAQGVGAVTPWSAFYFAFSDEVVTLQGMTIENTGALGLSSAVAIFSPAQCYLENGATIGAGFYYQLWCAGFGSGIVTNGGYTISGGAVIHFYAEEGGSYTKNGGTVTLTGTPAFSQCMFALQVNSYAFIVDSFSGSATGKRFEIGTNSTMVYYTAGLVYKATDGLPGNAAGLLFENGNYNGLTSLGKKPTEHAFTNLPATPIIGMFAIVNDSNTATWGATVAAGGAFTVLAWYNGTNWTVVGK